MVPPSSDRIPRVPPYLSRAQFHIRIFAYGAITHYGRPFQSVPLSQRLKLARLFPFRSPLLWESRLISVPAVTEMFQFSAFAPSLLCIQSEVTSKRPGFPIRKSADQRPFAGSPQLIAGCHVLHRLSLPRHPPHALIRLTL